MVADYAVRIEFRTLAARAWVRIVALAAPLLGGELAQRIALRGALRLARYRVDGGPWERLTYSENP